MGSLANASEFRAGCDGSATPGNFWDGDIAYARLWILNGARWTDNQYLQRVEAQNKLYVPDDDLMELQWVLWDAGSPATVQDYTSNRLDGTYTGTTVVTDPPRAYHGQARTQAVVRQAAGAPPPVAGTVIVGLEAMGIIR